jgi:hypothetical protein
MCQSMLKLKTHSDFQDLFLNSAVCSTKELSITMAKMLLAVKEALQSYCDKANSKCTCMQHLKLISSNPEHFIIM